VIDLHTHTLFSDGELLPSELVRRAEIKGYKAIALTDHVDSSNIDFVLPRIVKVCKVLNRFWKIRAIPGAEITHAPVQEIKGLVRLARKLGARIVVVHGQTVSEPVVPGTNRAAIESGCDILAHPGLITKSEVMLARKRNVCLEITSRKSHSNTNRRLFKLAKECGAKLVLNNDAHSGDNLISQEGATRLLNRLGMTQRYIYQVFKNSEMLARRAVKNKS